MTYQFKIQLKDIKNPPVWRRIEVPDRFTFDQFHRTIQAAFDWENYHLYAFSPKGYGSHPNIAFHRTMISSRQTSTPVKQNYPGSSRK